MKTIPAALEAHIQLPLTSRATIWKITRTDGAVFGFTDHDKDLTVDDGDGPVTYQAAAGYTRTALAARAGLSVDNMDVESFVSSGAITERDLVAGLFDHAELKIGEVNWRRPGDGVIRHKRGRLGEVTLRDGTYTAEVRSLAQAVQQTIGEVYTATCRADLGDGRCKVDLAALTESGTVASVTDQRSFTASGVSAPDGYFAGGLVTFTSGANAGKQIECKTWAASGAVELFIAAPFPLAVGDGFTIYPGCDKRLATCRDKFGNVPNFRGEPYVPTQDKIARIPDA